MKFEMIWIALLLLFFFGGTVRRAQEQSKRRSMPTEPIPPDVVITDDEWDQAARRVRPGVKPPPEQRVQTPARVERPAPEPQLLEAVEEPYRSIEDGPTFDTEVIQREVEDITDAEYRIQGMEAVADVSRRVSPPATQAVGTASLVALLRNPNTVQQAVAAAEILGRPRAMQRRRPVGRQ